MDIFERKETLKFTQLLRVKLKNQKDSVRGQLARDQPITSVAAKQMEPVQMYDRVQKNVANDLGGLRRRNEAIRRHYDVEKAGITVNTMLFDEEAELFRHMKLSKDERFGRLRDELLALSQKHLETPQQLAEDYVLARVYKHCCFLFDLESLIGNNEIENEFRKFKEQFDTRARNPDVKSNFKSLVQQIHQLKGTILATDQKKDKHEAQGFSYNEQTFDNLFVNKFHDVVNVSTESSEDEKEYTGPADMDILNDNQIDSNQKSIADVSGQNSLFDDDSKTQSPKQIVDQPKSESDKESEGQVFNPDDLPDPDKFNWFKYLIDTEFKVKDEDGNQSAVNSADGYNILLNLLTSSQSSEAIQSELLDLLGFHNFELQLKLLERRDAIKNYCQSAREQIKQRTNQNNKYRAPNMHSAVSQRVNIIYKTGKNNRDKFNQNQYENVKASNYDLLRMLGFDEKLIGENKKLGLKEKPARWQDYFTVVEEEDKGADANIFVQDSKTAKEYTVKEQDNDDWKHIEIIPPPKKEAQKSDLIKITELPKYCQTAFSGATNLNQIQSLVYPVAFKQSRSMIVAAPTGAGKTNVALLTILREVSQHVDQNSEGPWDLSQKQFQIVYIAPLKALASEIVAKFEKALGYLKLKIRELTGDMSISKQEIGETHIIVATPEKWDVVTRKTDGMMDRVNCLVIDEIHLLNDERGLVLECLVSRAITTGLKNQKPIRIVGLSATLPNYQDVAEFIGAGEAGTFYFDASYRPTPLKCGFYGVKESTNVKRANNIMNDIIYENLIRMLKMGKQAIIFAHKRAETFSTALEIIELLKDSPKDRELFECMDSWKVKKEVDKSQNQQIKDCFQHGFGIHHAGMLRKDRNLIEKLFSEGHIKVLCSTATLAWGVNLPAYGVLIKGTKVYDSKEGGYKDVGIFDVQQIFGRAGRPQFDVEGEGIIITQFKQVDEYVRMMSNKQFVESNLIDGLDNCINAEISAGTITTVTEGVQWLKKSFFYQRVKKNPTIYGVKYDALQNDPTAHMILLDKVTDCVKRLNRMQLIRYNTQTEGVFPTDMGRIACNYYIDCQTMSYFMANLIANQRESTFLYHLAHANEFKQLEARKEELVEMKQLCEDVRFVEIDKQCYNEAHTKVLVLLECYLCKITVKTFSLISDMAYVAQNVARLLRAMFEIAMMRNHANLAKIALNWCKIVDKRLRPIAHPMQQFTLDSWYGKLTNASEKVTKFGYLKDEIVYRLQQYSITLDQIHERDLQEARRYLTPDMQQSLYKFASYIPYFDMEVNCQPITRSILKVQVHLMPDFEWNDRWNGRSEPFWIMVDNEAEILHQEFFAIHKKDVQKKGNARLKNHEGIQLTFFVPYEVEAGQSRIGAGEQYHLTILSDRWYDISYYYNVDLSELDVPDEDFPNTRLLPLRPLSIKTLGDEKFEELYVNKFRFFNPVQTQVFHTLFHTDSNALIGAPTGSGKTIMSELAMLRVFKNTPKSKIIFIAPLKALAKERIIDWKKRFEQGSLRKSVLELTGDVTPDLKALQKADVLITTPEKWDGISRNWQHRSYVSAVALVIIDEIHLLGQERGPVVEVIVSRMRYISEQTGNNVRFVGLSTALANAKDVADWMGIHKLGLYNFKPSVRPVPIKVFFAGFTEKHYCPRMATMNRPAYKSIITHSRNHPVLIFVSSRRQTRLTALDLIAMCAAEQQEQALSQEIIGEFKKPFLHMDSEEIHQISEFIKDENLKHTIQFGVGMHHAGLTESDRKIVEELFVKKKIQVLVTTSTLAWGVNFPARLVIVKGTEFYDPNLKRYVDFPLTDLLQMIGRAGRPQFDDCGIACVFVAEEKKNFYQKFLYEPFPVESSLAGQITDHLNAEIASGTLQRFQQCLEYLTWTYFFRRLTKNPAYYGLQNDPSKNMSDTINQYLKRLIEQSIDKLVRAKCVEYNKDDQTMMPTVLGQLGSFYYLSHETIKHLGDSINRESKIDELISVLANAKEFAGLPVRHNEDVLNEALMRLVPISVPKHDLENPHVKSNLLLQAHFERCPLPITDYITDTKSVLDQSIRILQGMIDVSTHKGYLQTTMNLIHLLQMIIQGQWLDQSPLINVPGFEDGQIILKLGALGIFYLPQLIEKCQSDIKHFFDNEVKHSLPFEDLKEIYKSLDKVPIVEMKYTFAKTNSQEELLAGEMLEEGEEAAVLINLKRHNRAQRQFVSISNYPKPKECTWFVLIGDTDKNELLAMKRVSFKRYASKKLTLCLPSDFEKCNLQIFLMCDSYIGLDQNYTVDLSKINQVIRETQPQDQQTSDAYDYKGDLNEAEADPEAVHFEQSRNDGPNLNAFTAQPNGKASGLTSSSLFFNGFATFDQIQDEMIDDELSDNEGQAARAERKQKKEQLLKQQAEIVEESDENQIDSRSKPKTGQEQVFSNIKMGIDMLLDSDDEDEDMKYADDDGMIEKDLDNWI